MGYEELIRKRSLAEEVAERIKNQIEDGRFVEGDKLPIESQLMSSFGVGRSSIREAVKMLVNMGYLSVEQGRGTFVRNTSPINDTFEQRLRNAGIQEMKEVRDILEFPIANLASLRRTDNDILRMKRFVEERKNAANSGNLEKCIEADIRFHISVAESTHNSILAELYKTTAMHMLDGYKHIYEDTDSFIKSQSLHEQFIQYVVDRDAKKASNAASFFWGEIKDKNI